MTDQKPHPKLLDKGFPLLWIAIIGFALFAQSISYSYTYLDDQSLILNSMDKLQSVSFVKNAFSEDVFHAGSGRGYYYRPILTLSFMADAMLGKGSFAMFHFSNIVYHILATFLLFLFFLELGFDRVRSMLFAMLFLVHPMVTQAVAWVPGRNDTLLAIFIFGSFIFWLKYLKQGKSLYLVMHLLFYLFALFTKENGVVLPVMIVLYTVVVIRPPVSKYLFAGIGWGIISLTWAVIRNNALAGTGGMPFSMQILSLFKNLPALVPFLGKALFPFDLSVFPILADMKISSVLGIVAIMVLVFLIWRSKPKQWFLYFFGLLWFVAFLAPSFVSVNNQIRDFSEHRSYLSLAGILLFIMSTGPVKNSNFTRPVPILVLLGIGCLFSVLTSLHSRYFKDQLTFWQNAVDTSPSHAFNYNNLGAMYFLKGDLGNSEIFFRKALKINPTEPMAHSNTGLICMNTKRPAEAEKYYLEEIRVNPAYDHAYYNLGLLYYKQARYDESIRLWEKTLTVNPAYSEAYNNLLFSYQKFNRKADFERISLKGKANGVIP